MKVSSRGTSALYSSFTLLAGLSRARSAWLKSKCHYSRLTQTRNTILGDEEESSRAARGMRDCQGETSGEGMQKRGLSVSHTQMTVCLRTW